jgi:hypothetical protein
MPECGHVTDLGRRSRADVMGREADRPACARPDAIDPLAEGAPDYADFLLGRLFQVESGCVHLLADQRKLRGEAGVKIPRRPNSRKAPTGGAHGGYRRFNSRNQARRK